MKIHFGKRQFRQSGRVRVLPASGDLVRDRRQLRGQRPSSGSGRRPRGSPAAVRAAVRTTVRAAERRPRRKAGQRHAEGDAALRSAAFRFCFRPRAEHDAQGDQRKRLYINVWRDRANAEIYISRIMYNMEWQVRSLSVPLMAVVVPVKQREESVQRQIFVTFQQPAKLWPN
ncbi:unnamed protein product [Nesidiocoris tenuis]|uniref:Uncharacterized protein n=1 Tax=Nesidiocoris tenuis TaxID=355587 RepID=A0A6H5FYY2_9HEMI|nr:unnamed protein product [Nesidiocoris tenuis]